MDEPGHVSVCVRLGVPIFCVSCVRGVRGSPICSKFLTSFRNPSFMAERSSIYCLQYETRSLTNFWCELDTVI
jgi:hypothetical protein